MGKTTYVKITKNTIKYEVWFKKVCTVEQMEVLNLKLDIKTPIPIT